MLYLRHFGLREAPFSITPDPSFFHAHASAQAALNTLLVALRSGEGFLKIVGEVGCGKTVLCRRLLTTLRGECVTAYIPNPELGSRDLMLALCHELGLQAPRSASRHRLLQTLQGCLLAHATQGRAVVVCIDEAQAMPVPSVESLRLLSNLETDKRKLLQIVLFGQPELDRKLARPDIRQLLQRITFSEYLGPMPLEQVPDYVRHRLAVAALEPATRTLELFPPDVARLLAHHSGGVPRLVNVLAHKCLLLAYGEAVRGVTAAHVRAAAQDSSGSRNTARWWDRLLAAGHGRVADGAGAARGRR